MKPYRSMLFVPGQRSTWVDKGIAAGADALILDLEDAVPLAEKAEVRRTAAQSISRVHEMPGRPGMWVRPNAWETGLAGRDLEEIVVPGLDGLVLPKVYGATDVLRFDTLLTHFELRSGLPEGGIELVVTIETAQSMAACDEIARCAPRVRSLVGATARDADIGRALGFQWTPEGLETLYLRSKIVLACRAAGLDHPLGGLWQDIGDIDGLIPFARQMRGLGYRGMVLLHPSHVPHVNEIFGPSEQDVAFYRGMVEAFETAERAGRAAVQYEGQHIDYAHARTAREFLAFAETVNGMGRAQ